MRFWSIWRKVLGAKIREDREKGKKDTRVWSLRFGNNTSIVVSAVSVRMKATEMARKIISSWVRSVHKTKKKTFQVANIDSLHWFLLTMAYMS